jgi:peptidyl-tRNA hydrolase, PTH2 family
MTTASRSTMASKQYIIVRADLKLPKGKAAAQAAHAAVEAALRSGKDAVKRWRAEGMAKIVVRAADEQELLALNQMAKEAGIVTALITDAGRTVVEPGTRTCLGAGPDEEERLDVLFGKLRLF